MMRPDRKNAYRLGLEAEFWAEILLRCKFYSILERRFKAGGAEIDLIARRGGSLVFVEVKARATLDDALISITPTKLRQIARGARAYLPRLGAMPQSIRCDAILVAPGHWPRHIKAVGELPLDEP